MFIIEREITMTNQEQIQHVMKMNPKMTFNQAVIWLKGMGVLA